MSGPAFRSRTNAAVVSLTLFAMALGGPSAVAWHVQAAPPMAHRRIEFGGPGGAYGDQRRGAAWYAPAPSPGCIGRRSRNVGGVVRVARRPRRLILIPAGASTGRALSARRACGTAAAPARARSPGPRSSRSWTAASVNQAGFRASGGEFAGFVRTCGICRPALRQTPGPPPRATTDGW